MDISTVPSRLVYRSLGRGSMTERLGLGFMRKQGRQRDFTSEHYSLVYCLQGSGSYRDERGTHSLQAGMFFQRIPGWEHTTASYENWIECFIALPTVLYQSLSALGLIPTTPYIQTIGVDPARANRFYESMKALEKAPEQELPAQIGSILTLLTDTLASVHNDKDTQMVETACQALGARLDQRFNLPFFCEERGWGYERFRKIFHSHMGISPGQYRIRRRIDHACQLLRDPGLSLVEIAEQLGYPSSYEFSGQFKKQTGFSPSRYRKQG